MAHDKSFKDVYKERFWDSYCVVDLETTGLKAGRNEIIEIGAVKVANGIVTDTFQSLVRPSRPVPAFITRLTGITNAMLETALPLDEVLPEFLDFVQEM